MSEDLLFIVRDVFTITGRGTVLSGDLMAGSVAVGDSIVVTGAAGESRTVSVAGVERDRKLLESASAGPAHVGLLVQGVDKNDVARGSSVRSATSAGPPLVPAAWLADPTGRHQLRYWDGAGWTEHVADAGIAAEDPLAPAAPAVTSTGPDVRAELERLRACVSEVLASGGPDAFAGLKLDIAPQQVPERIISLGAELERATAPAKALDALSRRAAIYEALRMQTEADRDRLAWAAIKEGHSGLSRTSKEWAVGILGFEHGSTFSAAYDLSVRDEGKRVRIPLMRAGRAVALGYCPRCCGVRELNEHLHCQAGHTKIEDIACVVPADAASVRSALEAAHVR